MRIAWSSRTLWAACSIALAASTAPVRGTTTALADAFSESVSAPNAWHVVGASCLTAGTTATPRSSIPACGALAAADPDGQGAMQLTSLASGSSGMLVATAPLSTTNGLQATFTDYAFGSSGHGADGVAFFVSDASKAMPTALGAHGGSLGYANGPGAGLANAYVGVGLDEYGNFSAPTQGRTGGPGAVPETIAIRGAATTGYAYLGGTHDARGVPVGLPYRFDGSGASRPANAPTIQVTLTHAGKLTVAVDHHDGKGFVSYYASTIVGIAGQPAVPANVYLGFTASGGTADRHQVGGFIVAPLRAATPLPTQPADAPNAPLRNPPELVSANGRLVFDVVASQTADGRPQLTYNGGAVPPTLRLLPGDTLAVNLANHLPTPPAGAAYLNDTNLHYHGLHVDPNAPSDDSIDMLAMPGQTLHYTLTIPTDHPTGLYWYHSHAHGEAERQNLAGMSGALVIDGIARSSPAVANVPERILIARDVPPPGTPLPAADRRQVAAMFWAMRHGARATTTAMPGMSMDVPVRGRSTVATRNPYVRIDPHFARFVRPEAASTHCSSAETAVKDWTLDGQTRPAIAIGAGKTQFWRLVNAGSDTYLDLQADNMTMQIVALDGVPLASGVGAPASMTVSHYVVPPASRIEFLVTGPAAGTTGSLRTNCFDAGSAGPAMPAAVLATIVSSANPNVARAHRQRVAAHARAYRFRSAASLRSQAVATARTLTYSDQDTIDGAAYDPSGPAQFYAQSGTTQEWTIVNNSAQVHTFHIHQIHFVLEAIDGVTQRPQFVMDNVNVPAATANGPGSVKLLLDFTDPAIVGTFLLHCHILSHEDAGMMAKIRIGTSPPMTTNAPQTGVRFASPTAAGTSFTVSGGTAPYSLSGCANVARASISGTTVSVAPVGSGSCALVVADASGLNASVSVTVDAPAAVLAVSPNALGFASPAAGAQNATISGGTRPYAVAGCADVAAPSITAGTLSVRPLATGSCGLTVSDAAGHDATVSIAVNAVSASTAIDNVTFHHDAQRSGWYAHETTLTSANVAGGTFGQLATLAAPSGMPAFGKVLAQPLYVAAEKTSDDATHDLAIVSTSTDQIYAFDATTRAVVWHANFTNPANGITQQHWSDTRCTDVNPDIGIAGTPVIDRTLDRLFVVVATKENGAFHLRLHALDLASGRDARSPAEVSATVALAGGSGTATIDPEYNFQRSALLEANGNVYVALSTHCDLHASTVHGWMLAYTAAALAPAGTLVDVTNTPGSSYLGAIWMAGYGPASDTAGNVYFVTGNGPYDGVSSFSMSALRVPGNLDASKATSFTPASQAVDTQNDADLGSGGVMLLPDQPGAHPHLLVLGGKTGQSGSQKYVLDRDALGGYRTGDAGALWHQDTGGTMWGGPAYYVDATGILRVVYGGSGAFNTYALQTSPVALNVSSTNYSVGCLNCRDGGSQPVISSNGTEAGSAVVWVVKTPGSSGGTISLYAFDPGNMKTPLFDAVAGSWNVDPAASLVGAAMVSPLVAGGRVYVPNDGNVSVFGLKR